MLLLCALVAGSLNVWADTVYKLTQVTSVAAGGLYVFEQAGHVMNNSVSSSSNALQTTTSYKYSGLTGTESYVWTLETAKEGGFYLKNVSLSSSQYLKNSSSTDISFDNKSNSSKWKFDFTDGVALISNKSNSNRFLGFMNSTTYVYKAYDTSYLNSNPSPYPHAITVYRLVEVNASDFALTSAHVALSFDLYNNSGAQVIHYTTSGTGAVTVSESDYVTTSVDAEAKTITVTPKTVTPSPQTITVTQAADATYAEGSATFTVDIDDSTPIPTHAVTFSVNGTTTTSEVEEGDAITFPANPGAIDGLVFVGWTTEAINGTTDDAPSFVTSATMGTADITYYAVFANKTPGGIDVRTDILNRELTGIAEYTGYFNWSGKTFPGGSDAVYAGCSGGGYDAIQLNASTDSSTKGIISTATGGTIKKVTVQWNTRNTSGRSLNVYGSNTAYTSVSSFNSNFGTLLGSITYGTGTELEIEGSYKYIGFYATEAIYLDIISIEWEAVIPDTYFDYCTTVPTSLDVTISTADFATFSNGRATDFSGTGVRVYKAKVNGSVVKLTEIADGIVPANTGVILYKDVDQAENITVPFTTTEATINNNEMMATVNRTFIAKTRSNKFNYIMQSDGNGGIVFKMATIGGAYLAAGKAYLSTSVDASVAGSARLGVLFDENTGIKTTDNSQLGNGDSVYDLQGRNLHGQLKKGLYIVNGKKVIIRIGEQKL